MKEPPIADSAATSSTQIEPQDVASPRPLPPDAGSPSVLIDLARQLVFFRSDAMERSPENIPRIEATLTWSRVALAVGAILIAIAVVLNWFNLDGWVLLLALSVIPLVIGTIGVRRASSQAAYEKVSALLERATRALSVFVSGAAILTSLFALYVLTSRPGGLDATAAAALALVFAVIASSMALSVVDSSRAFVRADTGRLRQSDGKFRMVAVWITFVTDVWVALQLAKNIQSSMNVFGLVEVVLIIAVPLVFSYSNHRVNVRRRLGALASLLGETQAAADGASRANASAEVKAYLRAHLVRLQTLLHTDQVVELAGFRVRGLVDYEIVVLMDQLGLVLANIEPPPDSETDTARVRRLRDDLARVATARNISALAMELRRRTLLAMHRL